MARAPRRCVSELSAGGGGRARGARGCGCGCGGAALEGAASGGAGRRQHVGYEELELNTKCVVEMEGNQTVLHPPPSNTKQGESGVP
ncbi:hypothetical protein STEG23_002658 [Scotinomys teguina]